MRETTNVQKLTGVYKALEQLPISGAEYVKTMAGVFAVLEDVIADLKNDVKVEK